jgi:hypothetical protein
VTAPACDIALGLAASAIGIRRLFWFGFVRVMGISFPAGTLFGGLSMQAFTDPWTVATAFGGVLWGILGGALPGIGPSIAMARLLPFT